MTARELKHRNGGENSQNSASHGDGETLANMRPISFLEMLSGTERLSVRDVGYVATKHMATTRITTNHLR